MKTSILSLSLVLLVCACSPNPCVDEAALATHAQDEMKKMFPVPESVSYSLDSVYVNDNGDQVVRGRVTYTDALGRGHGPVKYWIGVDCRGDEPELKFLDVDHGGPKWTETH